MPWPLQIFSSSKNSISDVSFPSIIFRTIYDDMQDKEFESINAWKWQITAVRGDEIFFKWFIIDY